MSHYHRVRIPAGLYFFTVVTYHRAPLFTDESRIEILREAFRKVMRHRPFQVDAVVVLPEHLHCIWRMPQGDDDFSSRWREIKKAASREIDTATNQRNELMVWQRRFWEHAIRDEADWKKHMDYIHYNPVKHGLVSRPDEWRWSSFRNAVRKGCYDASWGAGEPASIAGMDYE